MIRELAVAAIATNFTAYPGYGDRNIASPPAANSEVRIEATTNRGPIVELIVRCPGGSAIMSYSKTERLYCTPRMRCSKNLQETLAQTCR